MLIPVGGVDCTVSVLCSQRKYESYVAPQSFAVAGLVSSFSSKSCWICVS